MRERRHSDAAKLFNLRGRRSRSYTTRARTHTHTHRHTHTREQGVPQLRSTHSDDDDDETIWKSFAKKVDRAARTVSAEKVSNRASRPSMVSAFGVGHTGEGEGEVRVRRNKGCLFFSSLTFSSRL